MPRQVVSNSLRPLGRKRGFRPAVGFLREFGGLHIRIGGPGVTRAKEPFELDPSLCEGEEGRFIGWSRCIGCELFPVGELDGGRLPASDQCP